jgi:cytochrome bd ubiquinol oxidase subunit II
VLVALAADRAGGVTVAAAIVVLIALVLYAVFGGADFGGGVWDLFASGPRRDAQREAVTRAIGPVWEANHVWLIFAIVTLFTCFPLAFADLSIGLYAPLSLALVGIVLRGAAFVFRHYAGDGLTARSWTVVFGIASLLTPFFLGDAVGALATGSYAWTSPFALATGAFAVAVCAQMAAIFLLHETPERALVEDFRRRGVRATIAVWVLGAVPAWIAAATALPLFGALQRTPAVIAIIVALLAGIVVIACVRRRHDREARIAVGIEAVAILGGWFAAQAPDLVPGRLPLDAAAANEATLAAFLVATAIGAAIVVPSLLLLFRVFKSSPNGAR